MKNILGFEELAVDGVFDSADGKAIKVIAHAAKKPLCCVKCGVVGTPFSHGNITREVKDLPITGKYVLIELHAKRYKCAECGQTFIEDFTFVDDKNRMTTRMRDEIVRRVLRNDTFSRVGVDFCVSDKTVRRVFDEFCEVNLQRLQYIAPRVMGLDEAHIDKHFRLVVTDTENNKLLDMLPNNQYQTVVRLLKSFKNPDDIKVVTMDFAPGYAKAVRAVLPRAHVVIDKFHVIQLVNRHMDTVRKAIHTREKKAGTPIKQLKHERTLFMMNFENLSSDNSTKLQSWLSQYPELERVYWAKEYLRDIYRFKRKSEALKAFREWCSFVQSEVPEFQPLANTLTERKEDILRYFEHAFTNAYTESINNKIKAIEKKGMGYRFEVLRMLALFTAQEETMKAYNFKQADFMPSLHFGDSPKPVKSENPDWTAKQVAQYIAGLDIELITEDFLKFISG